jgi:hypothetical protein
MELKFLGMEINFLGKEFLSLGKGEDGLIWAVSYLPGT